MEDQNTPQKQQEELSKKDFEIGFDADPPNIMLISIPIAALAVHPKGIALLIGELELAKGKAISILKMLRARTKAMGVIDPKDMAPRAPGEIVQ